MPFPRRAFTPLSLAFVGSLAAACASPSEPGGPAGLRVVAGEGITDTIQARPLQALVIELRDEDGELLPGVVVRFESQPVDDEPTGPWGSWQYGAFVSRIEQSQFVPTLADTTDARGRASVLVQLGTEAGEAAIVVSAPELGQADTARYTVTPGAAAQVVALPADTALLAGRSFTLRSTVVDRFGNPRDGVVTYTVGPAGITLSGSTVTAQAPARSWVVAQAGTAVDTTFVSVVPAATIAANTGSAIVTFGTDGSALDTVATTVQHSLTTDWSPDGTEIVFDEVGVGTLRVVNVATGAVRVAASGGAIYGRFSTDAAWLYYAKSSWRLRRQARDGSADALVTMSSPVSDVYPAPSPDGTRLAYVTTFGSGLDELRVLTLGSGASVSLNIAGHSPNWSPTGTHIAFVDAQTGQLKLASPDGTNVRVLSPAGRYQRGIDWSPDGRWLVAWNTASNRIDLVDTQSSLVLPLGFTSGWTAPSWKP